MSYDPNTPSNPSYPPPPQNYGDQGQQYGQQGYGQQGYGNAPAYGGPGAYPNATPRSNQMALAAMIVGIVSLVLIWLPIVSLIGIVGAIVGLVLGIIALRRANAGAGGKGQALTGIITSAVALLIIIVLVAFVGAMVAGSS